MIKQIKISNKTIGYDLPCYIIAEAGVNHNGRLDLALKLVDKAAEAGADAVKFQTFRAEQVVIAQGEMASYQKKNLGYSESQVKMLRKLELREKDYPKIIAHCRKRKITFLSAPHGGFQSVDLLVKYKVPAFKFGSGDLTNLPVLDYAARFGKPMIISTGMGTAGEIKKAVAAVKKCGNDKIILLHCTSNYPCAPANVNLKAMQTMMNDYNCLVGYSDHTMGIQVPIMAATLGVCVIEKHFTLSRKMKGPDHAASLEPRELKEMVYAVRAVKTILGSPFKSPTSAEKNTAKIARKSLVSLKPIAKGERFTKENIGIKRPGTGLAPEKFFELFGHHAKRNIAADVLIKRTDFQ